MEIDVVDMMDMMAKGLAEQSKNMMLMEEMEDDTVDHNDV